MLVFFAFLFSMAVLVMFLLFLTFLFFFFGSMVLIFVAVFMVFVFMMFFFFVVLVFMRPMFRGSFPRRLFNCLFLSLPLLLRINHTTLCHFRELGYLHFPRQIISNTNLGIPYN